MAKKIGAIVSLSIIGILILTTIIMANVNVNYSIRCATPTHVYVSQNSVDGVKDAKEHTNKIIELISNASKEKSLTALFNGTLNKKATVVKASSVGKNIESIDGFFVRYFYENPQKLMEGKNEYKDINGNAVYYDELVFEVKEVKGSSVVTVYVVQDATNASSYTYSYQLEADFGPLYTYLADVVYAA